MIGQISEGALVSFGHRRHRLAEEIAQARRRAREKPDDLAAHHELERLMATMDSLNREAAAAGIRIPGPGRYRDPFS